MNVTRLDIDAPPFPGITDHDALPIEDAHVSTALVVRLDVAVCLIPLVKALPISRTPAHRAVGEAEALLAIEERCAGPGHVRESALRGGRTTPRRSRRGAMPGS